MLSPNLRLLEELAWLDGPSAELDEILKPPEALELDYSFAVQIVERDNRAGNFSPRQSEWDFRYEVHCCYRTSHCRAQLYE
jgi:hypothetical protein